MSIASAFMPQSNTIAVPVIASAVTQPLTPALMGLLAGNVFPNAVRIVNTSANFLYISITSAARTAVIPTDIAPQAERPILPMSAEVFGLNAGGRLAVFVNTIGAGTGTLYLTFGEGV